MPLPVPIQKKRKAHVIFDDEPEDESASPPPSSPPTKRRKRSNNDEVASSSTLSSGRSSEDASPTPAAARTDRISHKTAQTEAPKVSEAEIILAELCKPFNQHSIPKGLYKAFHDARISPKFFGLWESLEVLLWKAAALAKGKDSRLYKSELGRCTREDLKIIQRRNKIFVKYVIPRLIPVIQTIVNDPERRKQVVHMLGFARSRARSDDNSTLKELSIKHLLTPDGEPSKMDPDCPKKERGWFSLDTAYALCPWRFKTLFEKDPERFCARLRNEVHRKSQESRIIVTADQFPLFLWDMNEFTPGDPLQGFLRGPTLVRAARGTLNGKQNAGATFNGPQRQGRQPVSKKYHFERIENETIAYFACQIRYALSNAEWSSDVDGDFNLAEFYDSVLSALEVAEENSLNWHFDLMGFWNRMILGNDCPEEYKLETRNKTRRFDGLFDAYMDDSDTNEETDELDGPSSEPALPRSAGPSSSALDPALPTKKKPASSAAAPASYRPERPVSTPSRPGAAVPRASLERSLQRPAAQVQAVSRHSASGGLSDELDPGEDEDYAPLPSGKVHGKKTTASSAKCDDDVTALFADEQLAEEEDYENRHRGTKERQTEEHREDEYVGSEDEDAGEEEEGVDVRAEDEDAGEEDVDAQDEDTTGAGTEDKNEIVGSYSGNQQADEEESPKGGAATEEGEEGQEASDDEDYIQKAMLQIKAHAISAKKAKTFDRLLSALKKSLFPGSSLVPEEQPQVDELESPKPRPTMRKSQRRK